MKNNKFNFGEDVYISDVLDLEEIKTDGKVTKEGRYIIVKMATYVAVVNKFSGSGEMYELHYCSEEVRKLALFSLGKYVVKSAKYSVHNNLPRYIPNDRFDTLRVVSYPRCDVRYNEANRVWEIWNVEHYGVPKFQAVLSHGWLKELYTNGVLTPEEIDNIERSLGVVELGPGNTRPGNPEKLLADLRNQLLTCVEPEEE